jgi:hypothetical protein
MSRNRIIMVLFAAVMLLALAAALYTPRAPERARAPASADVPRPAPQAAPPGEPTQADIPPPRPFGLPDVPPNRTR